MPFTNDITRCLKVLKEGGVILYPTDTVWGIGCDATNEQAVNKIFTLKQREETKSMIILVADVNDIWKYADAPGPVVRKYLSDAAGPTTVIYENGKNITSAVISNDGTIAIRVVKDDFCEALINAFKKPIVSTSANISGEPAPPNFTGISEQIKKGVDYIVQHRHHDFKVAKPSAIIRVTEEKISVIRP